MAQLAGHRPNNIATSRRPLSGLRVGYVKLVVRLLRFLGFKLTTVSDALKEPSGRYACLTFDGGERDIYRLLEPCLSKLGVPASVFVATRELVRRPSSSHLLNATAMNWKHLKSLKSKGWEIGTIGHDAVDLTQRSSVDQRRLIARARDVLTDQLGAAPNVFAYPFGAYDATTLSCVKEEGFGAALTLRRGINDGAPEALHLRRLPLTANILRDSMTIVRTILAPARTDPDTATRLNGERDSMPA